MDAPSSAPIINSPMPVQLALENAGFLYEFQTSWDTLVDNLSQTKGGTYSSKHALLKQLADLNSIREIELILCIYRMNAINTPDIGSVLKEHRLDYIPEAHCYLKIEGRSMDFTSSSADFSRIEADVLLEQVIRPAQVVSFKEDFHRQFLQKWVKDNKLELTFEQVWEVREKCISNLIQTSNH